MPAEAGCELGLSFPPWPVVAIVKAAAPTVAQQQSLRASKLRHARHILLAVLCSSCCLPVTGVHKLHLLLGLLTAEFLVSSCLPSACRRLFQSAPIDACRRSSIAGLSPIRLRRRFRLLAILLLTAPIGGAVATSVGDEKDTDDGGNGLGQAGRQLETNRRLWHGVTVASAAAGAAVALLLVASGLTYQHRLAAIVQQQQQQPSLLHYSPPIQERPGNNPQMLQLELPDQMRLLSDCVVLLGS